jgi:hypothetical protein
MMPRLVLKYPVFKLAIVFVVLFSSKVVVKECKEDGKVLKVLSWF